MIYLHKLIPLIISPLGIALGILIVEFYFKRSKFIFFALLLLVISSLPVTANLIWRSLEFEYPPRPISELTFQRAVVVLSGGLNAGKSSNSNSVDWLEPDRFFAGLEILRSNKAHEIIFTGGKLPWQTTMSEGEILKDKALFHGVKVNQMHLTAIAANTLDEAKVTKVLLKKLNIEKVILVTSSFHMPRAAMLFKQQGINFEAYPVDFKFNGLYANWMSVVPSAGGLYKTSRGIREYIGRAYYYSLFVLKKYL